MLRICLNENNDNETNDNNSSGNKNNENTIGTNVNTKKPIKFGRIKEYATSVFLTDCRV